MVIRCEYWGWDVVEQSWAACLVVHSTHSVSDSSPSVYRDL